MLPRLKQLRNIFSISQQQLAEAVQVSQQSINQYENHSVEPDIETLKKMADYFGTTIDYITGYANTRYPIENTSAYHLNADEGEVITKYRALTQKERACVAQVIDTLLDR